MLIIRKKQLEVFQRAAERNFHEKLVEHLRKHHKKAIESLPDDILQQRVAEGIQRAASYGLTWKSMITTFVSLMFEISCDFDKHPRFQRLLTDESVEPNSRLELLLEKTTEKDWYEAAQRGQTDVGDLTPNRTKE